MFEYDKSVLEKLNFTMLYPPEGDSSVLEVSEDSIGEFLHVMLTEGGGLVFSFFSKSTVNITIDKIMEIQEVARKRLSMTDSSSFE